MIARILVGAAFGIALSSAALAQSYTAPAGIPAATAPGGLEGRAAARNVGEVRGRAIRPAPGRAAEDSVVTTGSVRGPAARHGHVID